MLVRRGAEREGRRLPMTARGAAGFLLAARLLELDSAAEYAVEAGGVRSPSYQVTVATGPSRARWRSTTAFPPTPGSRPSRWPTAEDVAAPARDGGAR